MERRIQALEAELLSLREKDEERSEEE